MRHYIALIILMFVEVSWATHPSYLYKDGSTTYETKNGILAPTENTQDRTENISLDIVKDGSQEYANEKGILVPVKIDKNEVMMAIGQPTQTDASALDILRLALNQEAMLEHKTQQELGWFKGANRRFPTESITFFIATGLVIYETAWAKAHGDPLAMERHILSLKDPVANFSFYAFMQANGYHMSRKVKGIPDSVDPQTRAQMMRRFSYGGMVWGSLASSLVSDIFMPFKACLDRQFSSDYRFDKHLEEKCQADLSGISSQWTARNKFGQYAPQILSLILSQKASEFASAAAGNTMKRISGSKLVNYLANTKFGSKVIFKITGADVMMSVVPGRGPIIVIRWIGKLTNFTMFMGIDHLMSNYIYRGFNNLWKPTAFSFDVMKINRLWNSADRFGWDDSKVKEAYLECPIQNAECLKFADLPKEIENFSIQTQQWREHLNAENETDLAGWMEMTKKILNQVSLTYSFYKSYVHNLSDTLNVGNRIKSGESESTAVNNYSLYPYRQLPLYGVKFKENSKKDSKISVRDQYLVSPHKMEPYQVAYIQEIMTKNSNDAQVMTMIQKNKSRDEKWKTLVSKLTSHQTNEIGLGLVELNTMAGIYGIEKQQKAGVLNDTEFTKFIKTLRGEIGDPLPIMYAGAAFSQAFAISENYVETAREANFSWNSRTYSFNKDSDYFTYQMICGSDKGSLTDNFLFTDNFQPPRIIKTGAKPVQLCNSAGTLVLSSSLYGMELTDSATGAKYKNVTDYITANINYDILGDYRDDKTKKQFDKWWAADVKEKIRPRFHDFDEKFKILAAKNKDVIMGNNASDTTFMDFFKTGVKEKIDLLDFGSYLPRSIGETFKWELEFYLDVLQSVAKKQEAKKDNPVDFMKIALDHSKSSNSTGVYGTRVYELNALKASFNDYFKSLAKDEITFEEYIETSTKIRDLIDLIKIRLGTKDAQADAAEMMMKMMAANTAKLPNAPDQKKEEKVESEEQMKVKKEIEKINITQYPTKNKAAVAALQGLGLLEAEMRRFLRMKLLLSQTLDIDTKELMEDMKSNSSTPRNTTSGRSATTRGGQ